MSTAQLTPTERALIAESGGKSVPAILRDAYKEHHTQIAVAAALRVSRITLRALELKHGFTRDGQ